MLHHVGPGCLMSCGTRYSLSACNLKGYCALTLRLLVVLSTRAAVQVFTLCIDDTLDEMTLRKVLASGHSRVPVHRPGNR